MRERAPNSFLADIQKQIHTRSKGRFFGGRRLLFGRIPFEWVSLAMIVAMLVYYIITQHASPTQVAPGTLIGGLVHGEEQHLQVLALDEAGRQRVIGAGAGLFQDAHGAAGLLGAGGDDALEVGRR